nr:MAG TPA: minor capsid protein [Caudoviricetes sp.]
MADYGHRETDKRLELMEKRVGAIYKQASEEMREKLAKWYKDFERLDKQKADLVEKGELPKADYLAWRKRKMVESGRLKALVDTLTEDYVNSDKIAMQIVSGDLTDVYALNANYAAYKIEQDANVNLSWTLYDHSTVERMIREDSEILPLPSVNVPLDERWNRQHLNIAITQGILQGESIPHIGDRLQRILGMDRTAAIRSARTATTAAECAGRIDTYKYAESIGIEMQQEWVATLDDRTRHEHRILDGQRVDVGEAFQVDGASIRYPGDPQAPGYLVYNCRCTLVSAVKGIDQSGAARRSKLGNVSYEDWKAGKEISDGNKWQTITNYSQNSCTIKEKVLTSPIKSNESHYKKLLDDLETTSKTVKLDYNPVRTRTKNIADDEIISALAGGDKTKGSCASVALAYVGQKQGWDVLDFRDGESRYFFCKSRNLLELSKADGISALHYGDVVGKSSCTLANNFLKKCEIGKEYYLGAGRHAAIVRKNESGVLQYLELQSAVNSGWTNFNKNPKYTLTNRFGCSSASGHGEHLDFMINITDSNFGTDDFKSLLGYLNTVENEQRKGQHGTIK